MPALFAFLHHVAAFVVFGALFAELMLIKHSIDERLARSLLRADAIYGISAGALIVFGLVRVHFTEKGAAYYLHSGAFIAKIVLFVIVGLISIQPTRQFLAWRRQMKAGSVPSLDPTAQAKIRRVIHVELALLMLIILCAVLMARGIGHLA